MTSGRNDLWMLMYYHNGSSITSANSVEWNNWVLARNSYAGTNTGWNQIQAASGTNWGKIANYMDAKLFSGKNFFIEVEQMILLVLMQDKELVLCGNLIILMVVLDLHWHLDQLIQLLQVHHNHLLVLH